LIGRQIENRGRIRRLGSASVPTFRYWMETEVHVYAFSIAVNILLSFYPFLIVMVSICHNALHWKGAENAVYLALGDFFPDDLGHYISRNLRAAVETRHPIQWISILLLFFTANGIFEPLEVAMNRAWGVRKNRTFFRNQLVSLGLIFACGALALISTVLTAVNREALPKASAAMSLVFFKAAAVPMSFLGLFFIYWILPNRKLPPKDFILPAITVGLLLEVLKYLNILTWPWLRIKLQHEYGPFYYAIAIVLWSFCAALLILAGAEWSARRALRDNPAS
jgi:membrane protein